MTTPTCCLHTGESSHALSKHAPTSLLSTAVPAYTQQQPHTAAQPAFDSSQKTSTATQHHAVIAEQPGHQSDSVGPALVQHHDQFTAQTAVVSSSGSTSGRQPLQQLHQQEHLDHHQHQHVQHEQPLHVLTQEGALQDREQLPLGNQEHQQQGYEQQEQVLMRPQQQPQDQQQHAQQQQLSQEQQQHSQEQEQQQHLQQQEQQQHSQQREQQQQQQSEEFDSAEGIMAQFLGLQVGAEQQAGVGLQGAAGQLPHGHTTPAVSQSTIKALLCSYSHDHVCVCREAAYSTAC